jgi:formate-nitrite transporter family protein
VLIIIIITHLIGLASFAPIIAGSVEVFYLVVTSKITLLDYVANFMVLALVGNIIGGVALVAALNYAQVVAGGITDAGR